MFREPYCKHCEDVGMVPIWSGESIAAFKIDELKFVRRVAVACRCKRGERYLETCRKWRFDPDTMFPWNGDSPEQRELLRDFLERRREAAVAAATFNPDDWQ